MDTALIKKLILSGQIKTFPELFLYATKKDIAEAMKCSINHIDSLIDGSGKVYLIDVFELSEALGLDKGMVMNLWVE